MTQTQPAPAARLLLVDDDLLLRSMAVKSLRHAGFTVNEASTGEQAIAIFEREPFDLVLLDLMLPGLSGYEVCERIRATAKGLRVPILMLTGLSDTESIELAYQSGATDFITKPINWTLLSHRVRYALRASEAAESMVRTSQTLERAQRIAGLVSWQVDANRRLQSSEQIFTLYGRSQSSADYTNPHALNERVVLADQERVSAARRLLWQQGTPYALEFQILGFDGVTRTLFEQANRRAKEAHLPMAIEGVTQDITARAMAREQIRQLENIDAVTGLPNLRFFGDLTQAPLQWAERNNSVCALMHIDIDRFKNVNDALGRQVGNDVLRALADRLRAWTRTDDKGTSQRSPGSTGVLARVGSNSFALVLGNLGLQRNATTVAERLLNAIAQPMDVQGHTLVLTASIGVAFYPVDARDLVGLTRCAEQAAYAAKAAGRAQHRFFDEQMNLMAASRLAIESDLRRAIGDGELRLHFQPKVNAATGQIVGAEALVRWQHWDRGLVQPNEFIPMAEETGLILPLTDWVLENTCHMLRHWTEAGLALVPISVNLAAPSLTDSTLVGKLDVLMQRFSLSPKNITLEVTETMVMGDAEHSIALLAELRAKGYSLSMDDFGTGYSSLSYLKRLTIDELKIDRSFVIECATGGRDGALAAAIIALGHELGLSMVAEGIETVEQSEFLLHHGCQIQQGFLFSRPVTPDAFMQLLHKGAIKIVANY